MTIDEIRKAWSKAQFWGKDQTVEQKGSTHEEFKQEMAKKTVINRACKKFLNSSDDSSLVMQHINRADEVAAEAELEEEIQQNANKEIIDAEYEIKEDPKQIENNHPETMVVQQEMQQTQMEFASTGTGGPGF